ncbi:hypothetical protein B0H17DRAFT_1337162 [Mycena rosella]|uniref:BAH domain-containing protein n=1 Tax=Mycena rosella TaxID=1033263 RepID=A0AAD7CSD1_MYCRO|nr:hypothetical protein B0H17DRAFT_1337162 [Mycena rosella]
MLTSPGESRTLSCALVHDINPRRGRSNLSDLGRVGGMSKYGSLRVTDAEGRDHVFALGGTAAVLPDGIKVGRRIPAHKYWLVRILEIWGRDPPAFGAASGQRGAQDIWVNVNWYYSPADAAHSVAGFKASHCAQYERIYSNHAEVISALTFDDAPHPFHPPPPAVFFTRYFLDTSASPTSPCEMLSYATSPKREMACICGTPYDLNETSALHVMHMCPCPRCRRFHHACCLLERGHWTPTTHPLVRLAASPDTDELPPFWRPANTPIVRGAAFARLGITGNTRAVVAARRSVYAALHNGTRPPCAWDAHLDLAALIVDSSVPALILAETGEALVRMCPECKGPI